MKLISIKIFILNLVLLSTFGLAEEDSVDAIQGLSEEFIRTIDNTRDPIPFVPKDIFDLQDPQSGEQLDPNSPIVYERSGQLIYTTPEEVLENVNRVRF